MIAIPFPIADPFVLKAPDGRYYLYGTNETGRCFKAHSSDDLVHWREEGIVYQAPESNWAVNCFWAPECFFVNGKYYLFFSANWRHNPANEDETFRIGVACSDHPAGPFVDLMDGPIFDPGYPIIDASLYTENGRYYLYYSRCCYKHKVNDCEESWIYGVELSADFKSVIGDPVLLLKPEQGWESLSAKVCGRRWNEGSFTWKQGDTYYMTFSANFFGGDDYAVGYATARSPLGPYEKAPENPILAKNGRLSGTGHNCMVADSEPGKYLIVYHGRTQETGMARMGFISKAEIDSDGKLKVIL